MQLRQLLDGEVAHGALDKQVLVFVPVFNVDGHERFGAWNRPNQRGPEQMGWRVTAQNYNLNRDYAKADAPEMQAMLRLVEAWDPIAYVDLHVTDGAQFEHDVSIQVEPVHAGDAELRKAGRAMRDAVITRLEGQGALPLPFYPSFVESDNPQSGFVDGVSPPRFSTGYFQLRNRFGMLVETHSWRDYAHRVKLTRDTVLAMVELNARHGQDWVRMARDADARAAKLAGEPVALAYDASDKVRTIDFRGYEYTRTPSEISGALMTRYDETKPQLWKLPLRDDVQAVLSVAAPKAGYLVPAAHASWVGAKLKQHGIDYRIVDHAMPAAVVEAFRADKATFATRLRRRPPAPRARRCMEAGATRCRCRRAVRADRTTQGATGDGAARTAGTGCDRGMGRIQQPFRAEGIHGGVRRRRRGARDAGEGSGAEGRVRATAQGRCRVREEPLRTPAVLRPPPRLVGRTLQPLPRAPHRRRALIAFSARA